MKKIFIILSATLLSATQVQAQQILSLEECKTMAVESNNALKQSDIKQQMAGYDRNIALSYYFPKISATGGYLYNSKNLSLVSDQQSAAIRNAGTAIQGEVNNMMTQLTAAIKSNPAAAKEFMNSALAQTLMGAISSKDISASINAIGERIDDALHFDIKNVWAGAVTLEQPIFVGGKIVASDKMSVLAKELSESQYDTEYKNVILDVESAYWQIVSIAAKKKLSDTYCDLLDQMLKDAQISEQEGVATQSDVLSIKVKVNEAQLMKIKAENGLTLSKMLLCKQIGLPLESEIELEDENKENIPVPELAGLVSMEEVIARRSETRSLDLASKIYDQKVKIARADMMPQIAAVAGYSVSNPNLFNGFEKTFNGMFSAGVTVKIPIFHGTEALQRTKKAKAEAKLYRNMYEDACQNINLQVNQMYNTQNEALQRVEMAQSCLDGAEENLRSAMIGFREGVVDATTAMAAQTAWLKAHSEFIDAGVELQMADVKLRAAQGEMTRNNKQ